MVLVLSEEPTVDSSQTAMVTLDFGQFMLLCNIYLAPSHFHRASGSVIRKAMQSLEQIGVLEKCQNGYASFVFSFSQVLVLMYIGV